MTAATFIVADDHPLFREALTRALTNSVSGATIVEADSLPSLQRTVDDHSDADLLLLDLNMPGVSGFSALAWVRSQHPTLPTIVVSANDDPNVMRRALRHGASGFIPKSSPFGDIERGIAAVLDGDVWVPEGVSVDDDVVDDGEAAAAAAIADLTAHQFRVLMMLTEGLLNKQIAYQLDVSEATIKAHITAIFRKLGVNNRTQAVLAVQRLAVNDPARLEGLQSG
ncbi:MAG: response regulator transcription factor [Pseudomonadota bacterium]